MIKESDYELLKEECETVYGMEAYRKCEDKKSILCIIPNLSMNGAQTVLCELLDVIRTVGDYRFCFISPKVGEYRDIYAADGSMVCIRSQIVVSDKMRRLLQYSFDAVILNTALVHGYSMYFVNTKTPVLWWIHESEEHLKACCYDMPNPNLLSSNFRIYGVTERVRNSFRLLYQYDIPVMHMSIKDQRDDYKRRSKENEKVIFVIPGAFTPIKGQDILLQAIADIPWEYRERSEFIFCGYEVEGSEEYYQRIMEIGSRLDCVRNVGQLDRREMYQLYKDCDCVIAPSRIDPTPTTIVEAMMFGKLTIASVNCGITQYMQDCVNGFVFDGVDELKKRLLLIINDLEAVKHVGERGRDIWEKQFSPAYMRNLIISEFKI